MNTLFFTIALLVLQPAHAGVQQTGKPWWQSTGQSVSSTSSRAGSSSSRGAAATAGAQCTRNASFLNGFTSDQLFCGRTAYTFPGLINGDCPVTACMLRYKSARPSPFGSLDF